MRGSFVKPLGTNLGLTWTIKPFLSSHCRFAGGVLSKAVYINARNGLPNIYAQAEDVLVRACGLMDMASVYETEGCRFDPCLAQCSLLPS